MNPRAGGADFGLPQAARLRKPHEFRRVYRRGTRSRGPNLVVVGFARRQPGFRLGVSVSKAHGPAVRRNKVKRLLREAFRLERPTLPGQFDLVLIPQPRERYRLDELRAELRKLVGKLGEPRPGKPRRSNRPRQRSQPKPDEGRP